MLKFFTIVLIFFILLLIIIFKKKKYKNAIKFKNISRNKIQDNKKYLSKNNSFKYKNEDLRYTQFYKNCQREKMIKLFRSNTQDKLKALKIAEELADQSTLTILRRGLRDTCPKVVEISAILIQKFK